MVSAAASPWNSLEIVKLVVAMLTPLLVAVGGYWINRRLKSLDAAQWAQQKVVERRIKAYDDLAPLLNRLFCYFAYVGSWKEITPPDMVQLKRSLDELGHISAPLFDWDFLRLLDQLVDGCFSTMGGWGEDAKLRTLTVRRKQAFGGTWDPAWDKNFADRKDEFKPSDVEAAYTKVMAYLAAAIGAREVDAYLLGAGRLPANYDISLVRVVSKRRSDQDAAAPIA